MMPGVGIPGRGPPPERGAPSRAGGRPPCSVPPGRGRWPGRGMPCELAKGLLPGRGPPEPEAPPRPPPGLGRWPGRGMPCELAKGLLPGRAPPGRGVGRSPPGLGATGRSPPGLGGTGRSPPGFGVAPDSGDFDGWGVCDGVGASAAGSACAAGASGSALSAVGFGAGLPPGLGAALAPGGATAGKGRRAEPLGGGLAGPDGQLLAQLRRRADGRGSRANEFAQRPAALQNDLLGVEPLAARERGP